MCVNLRLRGGMRVKEEDERIQNTYFTFDDIKEKRRLKTQRDLLREFDQIAYDKAVDKFDELIVLDLGSNTGDFIMERLGDNISRLVGIEIDAEAVRDAQTRYGKERKISFYSIDIESDDFADKMEAIMAKEGIAKFNVINLSMVLLHLKSPFRLLKKLRKILTRDGMIIVKDIDDAYNIAYPDENGYFERAIEICGRDRYAGYRKSGRQVYTHLYRAGFKQITQERLCLTTVGMDSDKRSALFDVTFSYVLEDIKKLAAEYPDDKRVAADLEWYENVYDDMAKIAFRACILAYIVIYYAQRRQDGQRGKAAGRECGQRGKTS